MNFRNRKVREIENLILIYFLIIVIIIISQGRVRKMTEQWRKKQMA